MLKTLFTTLALLLIFDASGQKLPNIDPLRFDDGRVVTPELWRSERRGQLLELLGREQYGIVPGSSDFSTRYRTLSCDTSAFKGLATRRQVVVTLFRDDVLCSFTMLIYTPNAVVGRSPMFLGVNFGGNYTVSNDSGVDLPDASRYQNPKYVVDAARRGTEADAWNVEQTLARGYGVATFFGGDIFEDMTAGGAVGEATMALLYPQGRDSVSCGFLGAVAWGLSRAMDFLAQDSLVDASRVAVIGCSRNGKIALWAAAQDERFAMAISSSSGSGGASMYRGNTTETAAMMNRRFAHWTCDNFKKYGDDTSQLPFDQHMLLALIAPRPLYVANSDMDKYVSFKDEFRSVLLASPLYELLGRRAIGIDVQPPVERPIMNTIGYHTKHGQHSITLYDWQRYWDFADIHLR